MPETANVEVELLDATGPTLETLFSASLSRGMHEFTIDGSNLAEGMYLFRVTGGDFVRSGKVICIK